MSANEIAALQAALSSLNDTVNTLSASASDGTLMAGSDSNNAWLLQEGFLVLFMQCGFAMLCAGSVRAKNAKNIILLNILDACLGSLCWYATGYAFAFGNAADPNATGINRFIGNTNFFLNQLDEGQYAFWFFQFTFAATSATIVSGAVAERCKFQTYVLYEMMLVLFVYPIFVHWVWDSNGWATAFTSDHSQLLFGTGVYDFAGDGPVHMIGGWASLAGAWILGPRIGRFDADGKPVDMPGHSASLTLLGCFILWFGWFGFNPGSTLAISGGASKLSATVAINTTLAPASAAVSTLLICLLVNYIKTGTVVYDLIMIGNGLLAGLVGVTGGCGYYRPWAAVIVGFIAGLVYYGGSKLNLALKIDDPLDAISVHAYCGAWGMIGTAAFAASDVVNQALGGPSMDANGNPVPRATGFIMGGGGALLGAHLVYILVCAGWTLAIMTPYFFLLKKLGLFRVAPEVELSGLDVSIMGGHAYPNDLDLTEPTKKEESHMQAAIDA